MDYMKLVWFTLGLMVLGISLAIGIIIIDKTGDAAQVSTYLYTNVTCASRWCQLGNDEVTAVHGMWNGSRNVNITGTKNNIDWFNNGTIHLNKTWIATDNLKVNYTYRKDSYASNALDYPRIELQGIANSWVSILVTVFIAAVIVGLAYGMLNKPR